MEENKVIETLERMEKKQNTLLESMSVILNYLLSETIKKEPKDETEKRTDTTQYASVIDF